MIRAVGNKRLNLSDSEYDYYKKLQDEFGQQKFLKLFDTDKNGFIISVTPPTDAVTPIGVIFFILNVMMNQRVRILDEKINKAMDFEKKVANADDLANIVERIDALEKKMLLGESDV